MGRLQCNLVGHATPSYCVGERGIGGVAMYAGQRAFDLYVYPSIWLLDGRLYLVLVSATAISATGRRCSARRCLLAGQTSRLQAET